MPHTPITRGTAAVNGTRLHYEKSGSGPAVILISGGGTLDARMWDGQVDAFARRHTVVRYDIRGIGKSARPDGPFSHSDDLYALTGILDARPAYIVGLSFAAGIAIDLALEHPEIVKGLVLAAPGLSSDKERNVADALAAADLARKNGLSSVIDMIVNNPAVLSAASLSVRQRVRRIYLDNADVFASDFALVRLWRPAEPPAEHRLSPIRVPTLILVGDRDTSHVRATVDKLAATIEHAKAAVLPGAGHLLNVDVPEAFNKIVLAFVEKSQ